MPGVIGLVVLVVGALIPVKNAANPFLLITGIVFGIKGNKWWEGLLLKNSYSLLGTVQAKNPADAIASIPTKPEFPSINADSPVAGSFHPNAPEKKYP